MVPAILVVVIQLDWNLKKNEYQEEEEEDGGAAWSESSTCFILFQEERWKIDWLDCFHLHHSYKKFLALSVSLENI